MRFEDGSVMRLYRQTVEDFGLYAGKELTEEETTILKDWIRGQNSDGAFECLEDYPIETEDGSLAISLWHGGSDYFIADRDELDEYIEQQNEMTMGVM